jgi:hypothetical protein
MLLFAIRAAAVASCGTKTRKADLVSGVTYVRVEVSHGLFLTIALLGRFLQRKGTGELADHAFVV